MITYSDIIASLPKDNSHSMWSNGEDILCESEEQAEVIADFLEQLGVVTDANTGYFDPSEDLASKENDECTGWYYVH